VLPKTKSGPQGLPLSGVRKDFDSVIRSGNSGCNSLGGNYKVEGDKITFDQIVSTLMACDDPRMTQEDVVHKVLSGTAPFKVKASTLTLTDDDLVLILMR
jgi:heat shock protein HslJ